MAKMFYTTEEALAKLGATQEKLDQYVKDGLLREFRDGAKIMFKVAEIDGFQPPDGEGGDTGEISIVAGDSADDITLSPTDTGSQIGLVPEDTAAGLGPDDTAGDIGLAPLDTGSPLDTGTGLGLAPGDSFGDINLSPTDSGSQMGIMSTDSADQISLEDTGQNLVPAKDDTVITSETAADMAAESAGDIPLAAQSDAGELGDQIDLDNGSSGSGLLDLSREADDTSLGAELLEEIYPGSDEAAVDTQLPTQFEVESATTTGAVGGGSSGLEVPDGPVEIVRAVATVDPASGAFGAMMVLPLLALIYLVFVTAAAVTGVRPAMVEKLTPYVWYVMGGAAALCLIIVIAGSFVAGQAAGGATKKAKAKKAKKVKRGRKGKS